MTEQGWLRFLRGAAFVGGIVAMYVSAQFSVAGFSIDHPDLIWIGWFLAILIVIVEFTWRKPGMENNLTMAIVGISAYTFGIVTNVRGLMIAMGIENISNDVMSFIIAIITGVFLEIMPEPFFSWGLTGKSMADMFGEVRSMINGDVKPIPQYNKQNQQYFQNNQPRHDFRNDNHIPKEDRERLENFRNQRMSINPDGSGEYKRLDPTPQRNDGDGNKDRNSFQPKRKGRPKKMQEPILRGGNHKEKPEIL